ncbi:MAG: chemotaxis-specific protein-glutamate methyltransferase CheB [Bacteroidales bacterium]|nr:chemotaxis-specific protein-glutamate methyltransferase CheB [Bacteroidales bacterium]
MSHRKIKVLIVEDTAVAQKLLKGLIDSDERFELVGIAENGKQSIDFVKKYSPDVISMDILMPIMDGVEATRLIMQDYPTPVVIVSSFYQTSEVDMAMKVLDAGAVTILPRPFGPGHAQFEKTAKRYLNTLKMMSEIKVVRRKIGHNTHPTPLKRVENPLISKPAELKRIQAITIGASAGGPQGLSTIVSTLPIDLPVPIFLVQHIDANFAEGFAAWLNTMSAIPVKIAENGEKALPGHIYLPPGDHHLLVKKDGVMAITKDAQEKGLRPSVDLLFKSIGEVYGNNVIAVLLSGMGKDGAEQLKKLHEKGAFTIAQEESSCLVYGMPGEAVKLGAVNKILRPENIVKEIVNLIDKL